VEYHDRGLESRRHLLRAAHVPHEDPAGVALDESFFGIIYTIDDEDDWTDPAVWAKANPNYGVSIFPDDIARLCKKAQEMPSAQANFLTKRLCVWVNADSTWMDMRSVGQVQGSVTQDRELRRRTCDRGLDLASKIDIASKALIFRRTIDEKAHYYAFARHYLPETTLEESGNSQYSGWETSGHLTPHPETSSISGSSRTICAMTRAHSSSPKSRMTLAGGAARAGDG
jgi:phage terminase large subunit-like protein